ncbi:hypothetical protein R1flu_018974 [Riccia fluitans]|uniref:Uncharacterized protein n=1 Tax=Riccia fluitans TaxID=41844 RepID=A0ABD1ZIW9_9MARC
MQVGPRSGPTCLENERQRSWLAALFRLKVAFVDSAGSSVFWTHMYGRSFTSFTTAIHVAASWYQDECVNHFSQQTLIYGCLQGLVVRRPWIKPPTLVRRSRLSSSMWLAPSQILIRSTFRHSRKYLNRFASVS